jgi:hypothetical protein
VANILAKLAVLISGDASGLNKSINGANKSLSSFQSASNAVSKNLAATLGAVSFVALGREIIKITSEFQKFEAVLTNTLGSNSEAQAALDQIREFAAKTPFSVQELTASFVKLANQGFEPTADEMRKLGDLAASTGKGFDQLTEAIIDAQTGEFERLKEFGIRASKSGDQVKFTFKGVQTQTEFTADSIRDYLLSLGNLEGVSGSMAAISETLGGKISNLGDSFDNLLLTLGNLTSGPLTDFIDILNESLASIQDALTDDKVVTRLETVNKLYVESANSIEDINENLDKLTRLQKIEQQAYDDASGKLGNLKDQLSLSSEEYLRLAGEQATAKDFTEAYGAAIEALTAKMAKLNEQTEVQALALIPALNAEIKKYEALKNEAFSEDSIARYNVKLRELREELELLNSIGGESGFLKSLNAGQTPTIPDTAIPTPEASPFSTTIDVDVQPYLDKIREMDSVANEFHVNEETRNEQSRARWDALIEKQAEAANSAAMFGEVVGDSLGEALAGQITFAQAAKKITGELIKMFLQRALAGIIASAASSGGPPPVAIALAAAGVAAISAMFAKIGGPSASVGGGASGVATTNVSRIGNASRSEESVAFNAEFTIHGNDLVAVANSQNNRNGRLKG